MRADPDAVSLGQPHGVAHVVEIGGMETAGDVGYRDQWHQRGIVAEAINAKSLAHVAVDDGHATLLLLLWARRWQGSHSMAHHAERPAGSIPRIHEFLATDRGSPVWRTIERV